MLCWLAMSGSCLRHRQLSGAWSNRNVGWYHQSEARCALAERPQRDERQARLTRTSYMLLHTYRVLCSAQAARLLERMPIIVLAYRSDV